MKLRKVLTFFLLCLAGEISFADVSFASALAEAPYWVYRNFITYQDASSCPYELSCSSYMMESLRQDGFFGIMEGFDRLDRCTRYEDREKLYNKNRKGKYIDNPGNLFAEKIELQNLMLKACAEELKPPVLKSRSGAVALSIVFPGAGQIYLGNYGRGFSAALNTAVLGGAAFYCAEKYGSNNWRPWFYGGLSAGVWAMSIYSTDCAAVRKNNWIQKKWLTENGFVLWTEEECAAVTEEKGPVFSTVFSGLMEAGFYEKGESLISLYVDENPLVFTSEDLTVFKSCFEDVRKFRPKASSVAAGLSVIPGLGQVYSGDYGDGINAFLLNGGLFALSAFSILSGDYADFILLELNPSLRFYRGNFRNAGKAAARYNRTKRKEIIAPAVKLIKEKAD